MQNRLLDRGAARIVLARFTKAAGVGLDFETNGKELWEPDARIVGVSLAGWVDLRASPEDQGFPKIEGYYIPLAHKVGPNADPLILSDLIEYLTDCPVIPYYTPMEAAWAWKKWKLRLRVKGDAYVAGRLLHYKEAGLKDSVAKYLGKSVIRFEECLPPGSHDFSEADSDNEQTITYCVEDAINALLLAMDFENKIDDFGLRGVYSVELEACAQLAMESADGYQFDTDIYKQELHREKTQLTLLEQRIFGALGGQPFLINSSPQLGKKLNALGIESPVKTLAGSQSWSKDALKQIADRHLAIPLIIEWKSSFSVVNTLSGKAAAAADGDGRVHPRWNPMSLTGGARFSCEKPPMPTLPKAMRRAFTAPPGKRWMMLQWKQPELRMLAVLSASHAFAAFLSQPGDVFEHLATEWGTDRETAKGLLYTYINNATDLAPVAARYPDGILVASVSGFMQAYPEIVEFLRETAKTGAEKFHVRGWLNRRMKCEDATPEERGVEAIYAVLSGSVATALKVALCKLTNMRDLYAESETATAVVFKGFGQLVPCYDTLYYVIDKRVPLALHLATMTHEFQINLLEGTGGEFYLPAIVGTGAQWGDIQEITPEKLEAFTKDPYHLEGNA